MLLENYLIKPFPSAHEPEELFGAAEFIVLRVGVLGLCILAELQQSACP